MLIADFKQEARDTHLLSTSTVDLTGGCHSPRLSPKIQRGDRITSVGSTDDISRTIGPASGSGSSENISLPKGRTGDYENIWELKQKPVDSHHAESESSLNVSFMMVDEAKLKNPLYEDDDVGPAPRPMSVVGHQVSVEALPPVSDDHASSRASLNVSKPPPGPATYEAPRASGVDTTDFDPLPTEQVKSHHESDADPLAYHPQSSPSQDPVPQASYDPSEAIPPERHLKKMAWDTDVVGESLPGAYHDDQKHDSDARLENEENQHGHASDNRETQPKTLGSVTQEDGSSANYGPPVNYVEPPPPPMYDAPLPPNKGLSYGPPENYEPPPPPPGN